MRILVVGGLGSIGSRYVAILKYLGHEAIVYDCQNPVCDPYGDPIIDLQEFDKAIIATPTDTHYDWCKRLVAIGKPFLCEKPLSKSLKECEELVTLDENKLGSIVMNYASVVLKPKGYDYFRTGNDGKYFDCCQLIYLNPDIDIQTTAPTWTLIDEGGAPVSYYELERSYIDMVRDWLAGTYGYTLTDGVKMTKAVLERMERDKCAA